MFWDHVRRSWDQYGDRILAYGLATGDLAGAMAGFGSNIVGRSFGTWAAQQWGARLGTLAGPVGHLIGLGLGASLGNWLGGLFRRRTRPLTQSIDQDVIGAHMLAARHGLNRLENEARSGLTYHVDRMLRALNQSTTSDRRLAAAQAERLPGFYDAVNQMYAQIMQNVLGIGREHQYRMHQLGLEALRHQDMMRMEQERLRAMRLQTIGQMIGNLWSQGGSNNK